MTYLMYYEPMIKNTMTQAIQTTSRALIGRVIVTGKQSPRDLGKLISRPKSNVHRHLQAQSCRNLHPESELWETKSSEAWLRLLMFAVLYKFGLQHAVGSDSLTDSFKLIRIGTHVGLSPSALWTQLGKMDDRTSLIPSTNASKKTIKNFYVTDSFSSSSRS